jgi:tetratricopeptide (TPR) repeat protein
VGGQRGQQRTLESDSQPVTGGGGRLRLVLQALRDPWQLQRAPMQAVCVQRVDSQSVGFFSGRVRMGNGMRQFLLISFLLIPAWAAVCQVGSPSASSRREKTVASFQEAARLIAAGNLDEALRLVNEGLKQSPHSVDGLNLLGMIYNEQGKYDDAVAQFRQALAVAPNSADTLVNLANSYANQNKVDLAAQTLRKALRLQPGNRTANYNLGNLLLSENKPKDALPSLLRIAQPDAPTRLLVARAYMDAGMSAAGLASAEKLSRDFPKDAKIHYSLGVLLALHRQYRRAAFEFEKADALQPGNVDILNDLGRAYFLSGQLSKAQEVLNQALALRSDSADTLYWLAQTAAATQKEVDALELLVRARKIAPNNTDILFLMAQLSMKQSFFEDALKFSTRD